jgi:hypothetical protein
VKRNLGNGRQITLDYTPLHHVLIARFDTLKNAARVLEMERSILGRWLAVGRISRRRAEDLCDQLGIHPTELWRDAYYDPEDIIEEVA